jgi:hypothetical protein
VRPWKISQVIYDGGDRSLLYLCREGLVIATVHFYSFVDELRTVGLNEFLFRVDDGSLLNIDAI